MKISTKGEYGLLAIIDLALHSGHGPVQSLQIAERQNIPKQYLDQLMLSLRRAGLVESARGRQGGYFLGRPANEISLLDVVAVLEGPLENVNFLKRPSQERNPTRDRLRDVWSELFSHTAETLQALTVEEFCEHHRRIQNQIMYYI